MNRLEVIEFGSRATQRMFDETRAEMRQLFKDTREGLGRLIVDGDEATRSQMRVLHEDVIDRIKMLGEAIQGKGARKKRERH